MTQEDNPATRQLLELDVDDQRWLVDLATRFSPFRRRLGDDWSAAYLRAAGKGALVPDGADHLVTAELLDLFFAHVPSGDYEGYYQAIVAKGREYQARELSYGQLMLAVHHFEQASLPLLAEVYPKPADRDAALMALDRLSDNAIVLFATSYFETTLAEINALQRVTDTALSTLDLEELLRNLSLSMVEAIGGDLGAICLCDATGAPITRSYTGIAPEPAPSAEPLDELAGHVSSSAQAVRIDDARDSQYAIDEHLRLNGARSVACVPLRLRSKVGGVVYVARLRVAPFQPREARLLGLLAERAGAAIDHAELYGRTARLFRQAAALQRVTNSITAKMALGRVMEVVIDGVVEVFGASRVAIHLWDATGELHCAASRGLSTAFLTAAKRCCAGLLLAQPPQEGEHIYIPELLRNPVLSDLRDEIAREGIASVLLLPFGHGSGACGALGLYHDTIRRYEQDERRLAQTFADQIAIAIANAHLYQEIGERVAESERLNKELRILDKMKADFLAMISHELRTPLTAILGYTDLLLRGARGSLVERQTADLETVRANGHRLLNLINDLIDFSGIEAGRSGLRTRRLQLIQILPQVLRSFEPQAAARSIRLQSDISFGLPSVCADPAALQKIVKQLLSNAVKFTTPGGTVVLRASQTQPRQSTPGVAQERATEAASPDRVVVSVIDSGIGIQAEQLDRIWNHFYQVDSSSSRRFGGTGLGLAIVKRLVEAQGGEIWATSAGVAGKGSDFSFALPVAPRDT